ncbi:MAG: hypothetical protein J6S21_08145 [Victivallales bacterium]|nr:hypothetical protein [Victivallales bacterium]
MKIFTAIISVLAACCLFSSCKTYSIGSDLPAEQKKIAVEIENLTQENRLTALVKSSVDRRLDGVPGIDVVNCQEKAGLTVTVKLNNLDQSRLASAKTREQNDRSTDGDAYQSVLFRQTLKATWTATAKDGTARTGEVEAVADVPRMNNAELGQGNALKELARDLAHKVAEALLQ